MIDLEGTKIDLYMTPEEVVGFPSGELRNKADYDRLQARRKDRARALNQSGQYPINSEIIGKLRRVHAVEV